MYLGNNNDQIIGKTITSYSLSPDGTSMVLYTTDGYLHFYTIADCCSESWIEHITAPKFPAKILSIEEKDAIDLPGTRQEYDRKYSTVFKTDQGDLEVEYRNSSNGYYGGGLEFEAFIPTPELEVKDEQDGQQTTADSTNEK